MKLFEHPDFTQAILQARGFASVRLLAFLRKRQYIVYMSHILGLMDNQLTISTKTSQDVQLELATRFKARRLSLNLTQQGLAVRSGLSWSSLKRFERTGLIALDSLLRLALVLDCLNDFDQICVGTPDLQAKSLDELLIETKTRRKGRMK